MVGPEVDIKPLIEVVNFRINGLLLKLTKLLTSISFVTSVKRPLLHKTVQA